MLRVLNLFLFCLFVNLFLLDQFILLFHWVLDIFCFYHWLVYLTLYLVHEEIFVCYPLIFLKTQGYVNLILFMVFFFF